MGNYRRRQRGRNNYHQETRSQTGKPPLANSKDLVPPWEKDFCTIVGAVPWWKVREAERSLFIYDRIAQWDDSAGEEAFKNAKARYWFKINDLPCEIPLPDPDMHIDDVDWDAEVDTKLILDLERDPEASGDIANNEQVVILDTNILFGPYTGFGWGAEWEDAENGNNNDGGDVDSWGIEKKPENLWEQGYDGWNNDFWGIEKKGITDNPWEQNFGEWNDDSWGREKNGFSNLGSFRQKISGYHTENAGGKDVGGWTDDIWGRNKNGGLNRISNDGAFHQKKNYYNTENAWEQNFGGWNNDNSWGKYKNGSGSYLNNGFQQKNSNDYGNGRNQGRWEWNRKKKSEGLNGYQSGYNSSRFQREDHSKDCRWRNGRGRRRGSFQNYSNK